MNLCPELRTYRSVTSEVINSKIKAIRLQSSSQQNLFHYFIYNRLMDYFHNCVIVNKQYKSMLSNAKENEFVTRSFTLFYLCQITKVIMSLPYSYNNGFTCHDHDYCKTDLMHPLSGTNDRFIVIRERNQDTKNHALIEATSYSGHSAYI